MRESLFVIEDDGLAVDLCPELDKLFVDHVIVYLCVFVIRLRIHAAYQLIYIYIYIW